MNNRFIKNSLKLLLPFLILFFSYSFVLKSNRLATILLSEVADQPNITTRIKSIGGHSGKCVEFKNHLQKRF